MARKPIPGRASSAAIRRPVTPSTIRNRQPTPSMSTPGGGRREDAARMKEPLSSRLLCPWVERRFTYREYGRFLDRLAGREVVPMREFARGGDLALRHDVDSRLDSALEFARLEHERG